MGTKLLALWKTYFMFLFIVYVVLVCATGCLGYSYPNRTQLRLCQAQSEALCLDHVPNCETGNKNGSMTWETSCDGPNCPGTCSAFLQHFKMNEHSVEPVPVVSIYQSGDHTIELSWTSQMLPPNYTTIYIIEETRVDPRFSNIHTVSLKGWVRGNKFQIMVDEVCNAHAYRLMAINEFGSLGYTDPVRLPGIKPGIVQMIHYVGRGVYFSKNADPTLSQFMAILEWEAPQGWSDDDIFKYEWNPAVKRYCDDTSHDSLPIFTPMQNQTKRILMTIAGQSVGCSFTVEVRAISKCQLYGPWTAFTVQLTNCRDIVGYKCQPEPFDPPGPVNNVNLSISSMPYSDLLMMFSSNTLSPDTKSPLLINLHIHWDHPTDLGSQGVIDHYIIRSGKAEREQFPIPPVFIDEPTVRKANSNIVELIFELPTRQIPYTYGVQIVAVAPGQVINDNQWGMFPMYTIQVGRNGSIDQLKDQGMILLDKAGIVIVYVNNTLPVHFLLEDIDGRSTNTSINRLALQWGPLVGPNALEIENRTILPLNQTMLRVYLQDHQRTYGIKKLMIPVDADDPSEEDWEAAPVLPFTMPRYQEDTDEKAPFNFLPLYILSGGIVFVVCCTFLLVRLHRRRQFKNLERRLINPDEHDVDENNEHYFIMRTPDEQPFTADDNPTVVADRWELPHCCLKIGRVLGSGAFGQVVKGRVSRSMLSHRGIDIHGKTNENHRTHVTVAIKMLQECSSETCSRDFLNEIQLMKDIGYHRNIVSILGCCTLREPYCLVVEHVPHGDLLTYLKKIRQKEQLKEEENGHYVNQTVELFSPHDLLSVARQVATGMEYLSQKGFVHRDLAARNVLVGNNKNVKIGDFGLARYIYDDIDKIYVNRRGGKLPLRWLSPESIFDLIFSTASDVWSFGILLYEIVTLGGTPYPSLSNTDLIQKLKQGYIMERPDNCCEELYDVMKRCWTQDPAGRPTFTFLTDLFTSMLEEDAGIEYFDFQISEGSRVYFQIKSDEMDTNINGEVGVANTESDIDECCLNTISDTSDSCCRSTMIITKADVEVPRSQPDIDVDDETVVDQHDSNAHADVPDIRHNSYSDTEFIRNSASNSSFHNGLYEVVADTNDGNFTAANNKEKLNISPDTSTVDGDDDHVVNIPAKRRTSVDRTSGSSDDVFTDCPGCVHLSPTGQCMQCGVQTFGISALNPRQSSREDSAIGSTYSDDSNRLGYTRDDSDNTSTSTTHSEEYLVPDSPVARTHPYQAFNDVDPKQHGAMFDRADDGISGRRLRGSGTTDRSVTDSPVARTDQSEAFNEDGTAVFKHAAVFDNGRRSHGSGSSTSTVPDSRSGRSDSGDSDKKLHVSTNNLGEDSLGQSRQADSMKNVEDAPCGLGPMRESLYLSLCTGLFKKDDSWVVAATRV